MLAGGVSILLLTSNLAFGSTLPEGKVEPKTVDIEVTTSTIDDVMNAIPLIIEEGKNIWHRIRGGDLDKTIEGILGAMGLIDPTLESIIKASQKDNSYANPKTPLEVYRLEQYTEAERSIGSQKLLDSVFALEGQARMEIQKQQLKSLEQAVSEASTGIIFEAEKGEEVAEEAKRSNEEIVALSQSARNEKASQDVLKAIAEQNNHLAQIVSGSSSQLANLGVIGAYQSLQLSGISSHLGILNEKAEILEVLMAVQSHQMAQLNTNLRQQKDYRQYKDSLKAGQNRGLSQILFVPGLYSGDLHE